MNLSQAELIHLYEALLAFPVPHNLHERALHYTLCARLVPVPLPSQDSNRDST